MRENGPGLIRRGLARVWRTNFGKRGIFGAWFNFGVWRGNSRPEFKIKFKIWRDFKI